MQRVGALLYGLGADEPTCTPLVTPLNMLYTHTRNRGGGGGEGEKKGEKITSLILGFKL